MVTKVGNEDGAILRLHAKFENGRNGHALKLAHNVHFRGGRKILRGTENRDLVSLSVRMSLFSVPLRIFRPYQNLALKKDRSV